MNSVEIINKHLSEFSKKGISEQDINALQNNIIKDVMNVHGNVEQKEVRRMVKDAFECKYVLKKKQINSKPKKADIKIPKKYQKEYDNFNYLKSIPQYEQRSEEWFAQREGMITASDGATALGESKYEKPDSLLLKKCGEGAPFFDNKYVHHGKKYEPTATAIYEHVNNCMVEEFGLMPHRTIGYLGASPDGIQSEYTMDGKFNSGIGTMLEIKCPMTRTIQTKGSIDDGICPHYYWVQVQQQLECCDCEKCDFWQCNIVEYRNREEYLLDSPVKSRNTVEQDIEIKIKPNLLKGCIIQLLPKEHITEFCVFKAIYIYPPTLDWTQSQYDEWVLSTVSNIYDLDFEKYKDYVFDRVLYWKLENSHNITIHRDRQWFAQKNPVYRSFWEKVEHLRNNRSDLNTLIQAREKRKKKTQEKKVLSIQESGFID